MALLPPPDISAAYVDDKNRPSKDFYNWIKSIYDVTRGFVGAGLGSASYAEGTFTPTLRFGGGTTGITYASRLGGYIKIGKLVTVEINITLTNKGSSTGGATITGLPFTANAARRGTLALMMDNTVGSSDLSSIGFVLANTAAVEVDLFVGDSIENWSDPFFGNGTSIYCAGSYIAAA